MDLTSSSSALRRERILPLAGLAAVLAAGVAFRVIGAVEAFHGGELVLLDGDSRYHLHRMHQVADAFPRVPWLDPMIAWPAGGPVPWAAGFDLLGGLLVLAGRAAAGELGGDLLAAALCPLLGMACVAATMELVWTLARGRPHRAGAALAAGILACVLPQSVVSSRFGILDHHVAEGLAMLLLARWALAVADPGEERDARGRLALEAAGALVAGGAVAVFTGSPLYVALVLPVLLASALAAPRPRLVGSGGPGLLGGAALAALASAPAVAAIGAHPAVVAQGGALAFGFPSWLQPLLLAAAGAAVCAAVGLAARVPSPRARLVVLAAGGGVALALLAFPVVPGAAEVVLGLREWLLRGDPWLKTIDEFQPIWRPTLAYGITKYLGALGFATPLVLGAAALALAPAGRARGLSFLWPCLALGALAVHQVRFGRVFTWFLAAAGGLALSWLAARLGRLPRLAAALPAAAALALAALDPRVRLAMGPNLDPIPGASVEAALDLRTRPPGPAPGVLTAWDLGNEVLVLADRPVVTNGFGPYPDPAAYTQGELALRRGEDELVPWLAQRGVGWVISGPANLHIRVRGATAPAPFASRRISARWLQEVGAAPALLGGSGYPAIGLRHFERLRPVFASTRTVGGIDDVLPVLWTYEVVAGARVHGRAAPGARVVLEIELGEHGRRHLWAAFADAGADGGFSLRVPLATSSAGAVSTGPGRLRAGEGPARELSITEADVRAGAEVDAGTLGAGER
ncbi:MAG: hypothetical protein QM704_09275 [Anaeromyxobacteraceae bacterium]